MSRIVSVLAVLALLGPISVRAQNTNTTSDNPLAGLDLGGGAKSADAPSDFLAKFTDHLVVLNHDRTKPADPATLNGVKYVAFYYSASWCPPCRAFTPQLVDFYNSFKKSHPNFELIFVDRDQDADSMIAYMSMDQMPWPAVRFDDASSESLNATKFMGTGIPDLVLVDANGHVLADSFVNGSYAGPYTVLDAIRNMVPAPATN